ncbi:glycosyl hydrolase family 43 protein [Apiospora arundinis]|uniref:Glycosyl hydrolase family 43 protein n=1 Tax=Apiospora arundinis TaxID=335852 RepID=A0ABR2I8K3_9PEZI
MRASWALRFAASLLFCSTTLALPQIPGASRLWKRTGDKPLIQKDFPDPSILQDKDGKWYAFATAGNGKMVQVAKASEPGGPWEYLDIDVLPQNGAWTTNKNTWAPDVRMTPKGTYVMYFSGQVKSNPKFHCVGTATATNILGPYKPSAQPFDCDLNKGGSIDPSGFTDVDGKHYVVYKIDGNSIGHGGSCNNGVAPFVPTPILLQEVGADLISKIGNPIQILDRISSDGPLVEAPAIFRDKNGLYVMFFSSGCFTSSTYNVDYAYSKSIRGPYTRSESGPLVVTMDSFGLTAPGGATPLPDGSAIVFHADCEQGRCFFESKIGIMGNKVLLNGVNGLYG